MVHSFKPGRLVPAIIAISALAAAVVFAVSAQTPAQATQADAAKRSLKVSKVRAKVSGDRLYVSARVRVPRAGHLHAKVKLSGRVLCHKTRKVKGAGTYPIKCVITRGDLIAGRYPRRTIERSGTAGATLKVEFEDYAGAWLKSLIPLPPLPPIPPPPPA